jgi:hypothetical protein
MSPAGRRVAAAVFLVFLLARPAVAFIPIPDPVEAGMLAKIAAILGAIQRLRMLALERWNRQIWVRLTAYAFPEGAFNQIFVITSTVEDIRRELNRLACVWPTTPRTDVLENLLLERMTLCRDDYRHTWGSHDGMWDAQLQEVHDYVGTMTANMISERTEKTNTEWVRALRDQYLDTAQRYLSPGEANRHEAAALAWTNQIAQGNAQVLTQNLLLRQMGRDLDRFDQKKADDMTYYLYRGVTTLAGGDWRSAPPDPSRLEP